FACDSYGVDKARIKRYGMSAKLMLMSVSSEPLPALPTYLTLPGRGPISPSHTRQRGIADDAANALGGGGRRIDRRDCGHPGGVCPAIALLARAATRRSRPPAGGARRD